MKYYIAICAIVTLYGCGPDTVHSKVWQVDPEVLADKLNREHVNPEGPHEWDNCEALGMGEIRPVHACNAHKWAYVPSCVWYAGKRVDGEWHPMNSAAEGELGAVCVCNNSEWAEAQVC